MYVFVKKNYYYFYFFHVSIPIVEGVEFRSALDSAVKSLTADGIKCIFHDESVGVDLTRSVASYVKLNRSNTTSSSIQWLTSSQVAAAVMSLTTPTFSDDLRTSMSQVFAFSQQSDGRNSQSQFQVFKLYLVYKSKNNLIYLNCFENPFQYFPLTVRLHMVMRTAFSTTTRKQEFSATELPQ